MPTSTAPAWRPAEQPTRPQRPPEVVEVPDAFLSRTAWGRTQTLAEPTRWVRGAVYDTDGLLVTQSQNHRGSAAGPRLPIDPPRVRRGPKKGRRLAGRWLYGGTFAHVYGHFLAETLTCLWPEPEPVAGVLFHRHAGDDRVLDWQRRFIELAGWGGVPVHVVGRGSRPVQVEQLVVPSRSVALHAWAHPEARRVWERIADPFRSAGAPERVYISRTLLNEQRRAAEGSSRRTRTDAEHDRALDEVFARHGFDVLTPERMSVEEQLAHLAGARVLAGLSGSGLHQSAFLPRGSRVLDLGDSRTAHSAVPMQLAIDAASGHERCFLDGTLTPSEIDDALGALGF